MMGEVGYRRMTELHDRVDPARGAGGAIDFETAARYVGPIIVRLSSEIDDWRLGDLEHRSIALGWLARSAGERAGQHHLG